MIGWKRDSSARLVRVFAIDTKVDSSSSSSQSTSSDMDEETHTRAPPRIALQDRCYPTRGALPSCLSLPPANGENFEIKPHFINLLPKFHGLESEDAYIFITKFQNVCAMMSTSQLSGDAMKLRLLPFTLCDLAEKWLYSTASHSITSWDEFVKAFLKKFYPNHKTARIRSEITQFVQLPSEPFWKCFERFKDLLVQCPHHGFEKWQLCQIIYEGINPATKQMLETICQCHFLSKSDEEAWQFLEDLAEQTLQWESTRPGSHSRAGIHQLDASIAMKVEMAAMQKKLEAMESKFSSASLNQTQASLPKTICATCSDPSHLSEECPLNNPSNGREQINATFQQRPRNDPYSSTYNPGWKNHPNFSWNQNQPYNQNQFQHQSNFSRLPQQQQHFPQQQFQQSHHQPPFLNQGNSFVPNNNFFQPNGNNFVPASADRVSAIERSL